MVPDEGVEPSASDISFGCLSLNIEMFKFFAVEMSRKDSDAPESMRVCILRYKLFSVGDRGAARRTAASTTSLDSSGAMAVL